jgi:hypothetical protein
VNTIPVILVDGAKGIPDGGWDGHGWETAACDAGTGCWATAVCDKNAQNSTVQQHGYNHWRLRDENRWTGMAMILPKRGD